MKYKVKYPKKKNDTSGGAYWQDADFTNHLKLTQFQTSFKYVVDNFKPPLNVLEAGCGLGRWVVPLSEKGFNVTGIELEQEAVDVINKNVISSNVKVIQGDIFKMPFNDDMYDLVISLGVLEHFELKELQTKAFKEHVRVLKDNGYMFITVPYFSIVRLFFHFPFTKLASLVRKFKKKKEYFSEFRYSKKEFIKIINSNGLKVVDIVYDDLEPPYNFGLMDYPIKKLFKKNTDSFKLNKLGCIAFEILWSIHPKLVSGGIGFVCRKKK